MSHKSGLIIRLRSSDGHIVEIEEDLIRMSTLISRLANDFNNKSNETIGTVGTVRTIDMHNIDYKTLRMVFEWCEEHKYDSRGAVGGDVRLLQIWDKQFFNSESDVLCDVFMAADILGIKQLVDSCFQELKCIFTVKSKHELLKNIHNRRTSQ